MRIAGGRRAFVTLVLLALPFSLGCSRKEMPEAPPPPAPVTAPTPVVRDAAPDVVDAASDAGDARAAGKRSAPRPAGEGSGGGGITVAGSLPRADGEKVVRAAQPKLRGCLDQANTKGSARKGRVAFKLTIDDRGHVTQTEIPTSTLEGGSDVETCMGHVLRDLRFPRGSGESTISFQMSFGR